MDHIRSHHYSQKLFAGSLAAVMSMLLNGCTGVTVATPAAILQAASGNVIIVAQSTPSKTTAVQSLRLQITSAVLNPGNVQLVTTPVTIDLAKITSGSEFLSSSSALAGTYSSLTITFANPSLSITNTNGSPVSMPGGSCAVQSTCTFVPTLTNSQAIVTTGVLPLTVAAGRTNSFALTLAVGKILQSDDSLDFSSGVDTRVDQSGASGNGGGNAPLDTQTGVIQSVISGQLVLVSEQGDQSPSITTDAGTVFNFPVSVCAANNLSCVIPGEIVVTTLSLTSASVVHADSISFADVANARLLEGTIVAISPLSNSFQILTDTSFGFAAGSSPDETIVTVALQAGAQFGISTIGYPAVGGAAFTNIGSMLVGQRVLVDVTSASALPNITSALVSLMDTDASGTTSALSSNSTFLLTNYSVAQSSSSPTSPLSVQSDAGTLYRNFSPANFSSLANGQSVSATGPLFNTIPVPILAAHQVSLHSASDQ